jgi:translation initiation factor eIF-2B subunit delta
MEPEIADRIAAIANDRISGAAALTAEAAATLAALADLSRAVRPDQFNADLLEAGAYLIQAQPSMASILNLVNTAITVIERVASLEDRRNVLRTTARTFPNQLSLRNRKVAQLALDLFGDGTTVVTLSYSSTVFGVLLAAHTGGRRLRVVCAESRPQREGILLAQDLGKAGIPCTLVIDAALADALDEADVVLVGADSVAANGLVNKIGTRLLTLVARVLDVPCYALTSRLKFWPAHLPDPPPIEDRDPAEVLADVPDNVSVVNRAFDRTPLDLLTGLVCERGVLGPAEIRAELDRVPLHPQVRALLEHD